MRDQQGAGFAMSAPINKERVTLELSKDGWTSGLQVSIQAYDGSGSGDGYRLIGPKFNGSSKLLKSVELTDRDAQEIRSYLQRGGL